jgi:hypothetical protein
VPEKDWQGEIRLLRERRRKARAILGVPDTTDRAGIRRAFRRASLASHPDVDSTSREAGRRFHLVCCAYKCLTEGQSCEALDEIELVHEAPGDSKYHLDNPWGYWCWWRDKYFDHHDVEPEQSLPERE